MPARRGGPGIRPYDVDDHTELDGERIDVAARLGWVAQMARTTSHAACSRSTLVKRLDGLGVRTNESRLGKLEAGERRGDLLDGYERALGLVPGQLRTPADVLCRTFSYAPADAAAAAPLDLEVMSADYEALADGLRDGGRWLRWARALNRPDAHGFPLRLMEPLLDDLVSETGRACGIGHLTRYEALALLRSGPYHQAVLDAAERAIADPAVQVVLDLFSAVSDHPTPESDAWVASSLADPRPQVVHGACIAIPNAATVADWTSARWAEMLAHTSGAHREDPEIAGLVDGLLALYAPETESPTPPGPPMQYAALGKDPVVNPAWRLARRLALRITDGLDLPQQPMLTRLLFEVIFDHREHRVVTSYFLLMALPFLEEVVTVLLDQAASEESALSTRVLGRVAQMRTGIAPAPLHRISPSEDPVREAWRLVAHAYSGIAPDPATVVPLLGTSGRPQRLAVLTLGLSDHPLLDHLRAGPDPALADAARWWAHHGALVRDPDPVPQPA